MNPSHQRRESVTSVRLDLTDRKRIAANARSATTRLAHVLARGVHAINDSVRVRQILEHLAAFMPTDEPGRKIVILAYRRHLSAVRPWLRQFTATDTVHLLLDRPVVRNPLLPAGVASAAVARTPSDIERSLRHNIGTVDLIIDLRRASVKRYIRTWARCAYHVRRRGVYIARPAAILRRRERPKLLAWAALNSEDKHVRVGPRDASRLLDPNMTSLNLLLPDAIAVVKRQDHLLLVTDDRATMLPKRESGLVVEVLAELPAGTLQAKATVACHESTRPVGGLDETLPYPRLQLRHYSGRIDFYGRTLLVSGHSVLPDSYRFFRAARPGHPLLETSSTCAEFATGPGLPRPTERLPGTYYLLDPQSTGHYGHLLTECVARLWAWDRAKASFPELKVLAKVKPGRPSDPVLDRLLPAYGITAGDVVYVDHPVELESVVTASAMWHNATPRFVHPEIVDTWRRLSRGLVDPSAPRWERIFVTRRPGAFRTCHNAEGVEAVFAAHGFEIVRPEQYDLGIQAGFFQTARVVAGFGGSGMFNLLHTTDLEQMIVLAHEAYKARNEHLYSAVLGGRADWFWSRPDRRKFQSDWSFDFDRNGSDLEKLLARL